jgi:hypothetical protein
VDVTLLRRCLATRTGSLSSCLFYFAPRCRSSYSTVQCIVNFYTFAHMHACHHHTSTPLLASLSTDRCSDTDAPCQYTMPPGYVRSIWRWCAPGGRVFGALLGRSRHSGLDSGGSDRQGHQIWQRQCGGRCVNSLRYT